MFRALILVSCSCYAGMAMGQNDPLWHVWNSSAQPDSARLKAMQALAWKAVFEQPDSGMVLAGMQLAFAEEVKDDRARFEAHTTLAVGHSMKSAYSEALAHLMECLAIARSLGDRKREANTYSNLSNVYRNLGDLPLALEQLQRSLRIDLDLANKEGLGGTYNNIGNIHTELGDLPNALINYEKSARLAEELDSDKGRAQAMMNMGNTHLEMGESKKALDEFQRSSALYRSLGRKLESGMAFNNMGRTYTRLQRFDEARATLDSARTIFTELGSQRQLARNHYYVGDLFLATGLPRSAIAACEAGLRVARDNGLVQQRKECYECLMMAYEQVGDFTRAFHAQQEFMRVGDSLETLNNGKEVLRLDLQRQFHEQQIADSLVNVRARFERELAYQEQLGREHDRRNMLLYSGIGVLLLAGALWNQLRYTRRSRAAIQLEKNRSDELLHNILPEEVAAELKEKGVAEARSMDTVTVLFTDFKGFTAMSEQLSPKALVADIHECFSAFDRIMEAHGIEKIKTIGDAYMAAGGLPVANNTHAQDVARAALEIRDFIEEGKARRIAEGLPYFEIRIGLHTGPVVAGIVGLKKFQYDIWGDTVNTASRMESSGAVGQVNISESTYEFLRNEPGLRFTPRGKVQAKGKGELEMYFVERA